ncbi:MAG: rane protein [Frankiales bacterium]|nr:rane protein [Frankiales bacterium]
MISTVETVRYARSSRSGFSTMLQTEWTLFRREPVGLVWGLLLPVVAIVIVGYIPDTRKPIAYYDGQSVIQHYLPIVMLVSLAMLALNALPPVLASYRERGVLRRMSVTPMLPSRLLAAVALIHLAVAVAAAVLMLGLTRLLFGLALPGRWPLWILVFALTATAILAIGILVAALSPSSKVANGLGSALFFPLMFLAGLWVSTSSLPGPLPTISNYSPLGASVRAMSAASGGHLPATSATITLLVYAILIPAIAVRFFRWE